MKEGHNRINCRQFIDNRQGLAKKKNEELLRRRPLAQMASRSIIIIKMTRIDRTWLAYWSFAWPDCRKPWSWFYYAPQPSFTRLYYPRFISWPFLPSWPGGRYINRCRWGHSTLSNCCWRHIARSIWSYCIYTKRGNSKSRYHQSHCRRGEFFLTFGLFTHLKLIPL